MARNTSPPSATGGAGYNYADKVAAKYLLDMLAGRLPFGPEYGQVVRVEWETRDETAAWVVDDLRLTLRTGNADRFVAVSLKQNRQVTQRGFPSDFVTDAWEMVLGKTTPEFSPTRDLLVLVVGQLSQNVHEAWEGLLGQAIETTPDRLASRISDDGNASGLQRDIFASLRCPDSLRSQLTVSVDIATAKVIRGLRLLHLDLNSESSQTQGASLALAKEVVKTGNDSDAQSLWQVLQVIAATQREAGGTVDLHKLLSQPNLPALREHADLRRDWDQLAESYKEAASRVLTKLGQFSLLRMSLFNQALPMIKTQRVGVLIGDSGSGKSALANRLTYQVHGPAIWLDSILLNVESMRELQSQKLQLQNSLERLIRELAAPQGVIVIDGIEKLPPQSLQLAARIIRSGLDASRWTILITCRTDAWSRIAEELRFGNTPIDINDVHPVPPLDEVDLSVVADAVPDLSSLIYRLEVRPMLTNTKVLAWTIMAVKNGGSSASSARSVPGLIDAIWDRWVRIGTNRIGREHALKQLAAREANGIGGATRLSDIPELHQVLDGLVDDELLMENQQHIRFRHDLIGDWARLKILIEHRRDEVRTLREKVVLPLWQRAIQLYGQRILQKDTDGAAQWQNLIYAMQESDDHDVLIRDLMLEALFTATDSKVLINLAWLTLIADDGYLLKRFLDRFLYAGTLPAIERAAHLDEKDRLLLQSVSRYPFWPYWLVMLRVLHDHHEEVVSLAPKQAATIASMWLKWTPLTTGQGQPFPCRSEAADLA